MKKWLSILMVLALMVPALGALAETTITVWCWDPAFNLFAMEEAAKIYKEINPDVVINIEEVSSNDCETKTTVALASGDTSTLPDIILVQDNSGRKFLHTFPGSYFTMTKDMVDFDNFAPYKLKHFNFEGEQYAVPFDNGCAAGFYRVDYLEAAGLSLADLTDVTWDEFIEVGLKVKEATGNYLITTQAGYNDFIMMMLQSAGAWFFDDDGNPAIDTELMKEVVETIVRIRESGIVKEAADWTEYIASFNNGSAGGTIQGCWIIGSVVQAEDQSGKWGMTNVPRLTADGATNYSSQGGSSWMVFDSSPVAREAVEFLSRTFGESVEFYQIILKNSGAIATFLPAAGGPAYLEPHEFFGGQKVFVDLMDFSARIPMVEYGMYNYEARDAVAVAIEAVYNGADVAGELQTAQATVEFLMEE